MLLVGSRALLYHTCGGDPIIPADTDYICTHDEAKEWVAQHQPDRAYMNEAATTLICRWKDERTNDQHKPVELMIAWPNSTTEEIYNREGGWSNIKDADGPIIASLNTLYLLKMSHRYLKNSPYFLKTMRSIQLMRQLGAVIEDANLLKRREKETYNYPHPSLMRGKRQFFDPKEGVGYQYDHDTIHLSMAIDPLKPAYTNYKRDDHDVAVDKAKWDAQPFQIQLNSVLEESLVLALERSQIPYRHSVDPRRSFEIALSKVCTSISSGWWREFAWEHYDDVIRLFEQREAEKPYLQRFDEAVDKGIVKKLESAYHDV